VLALCGYNDASTTNQYHLSGAAIWSLVRTAEYRAAIVLPAKDDILVGRGECEGTAQGISRKDSDDLVHMIDFSRAWEVYCELRKGWR
jgi:hypothetical protein